MEVFVSLREARLIDAIEALGAKPCCGEPSHGGSSAATGMVWEGTKVFISGAPQGTGLPTAEPSTTILFANGRAELGDHNGAPAIGFNCGDSYYALYHDSDDEAVHIRAGEALVQELGCEPQGAE